MLAAMTVAALVLAAGRGERLGESCPKAFVRLADQTLLERAIARLSESKEIEAIWPVLPPAELPRVASLNLDRFFKLRPAVAGGAERQDSMAAGLAALPSEIDFVAIHDAARCLVDPEDVSRTVAAARQHGAAILAHPARDTIKRVRGHEILETPSRSECWIAETPQVFRRELLEEGLAKARAEGFLATDDSQLVERLGVAVQVVEGGARNLKITGPEDLAVALAWLREEPAGGS